MKLSDKGQIKIGEFLCIFGRSLAGSRATALAQLAFEPYDFKGCVVLTLEEAVEILDYLSYLELRGYRDSFLDGLTECCRKVYARIEQAEKQ